MGQKTIQFAHQKNDKNNKRINEVHKEKINEQIKPQVFPKVLNLKKSDSSIGGPYTNFHAWHLQ